MLSGNGWLAAVEKAKLRGARAPAERPEDLFAYPLNIARRPTTKQPKGLFVGEQRRCEKVGDVSMLVW